MLLEQIKLAILWILRALALLGLMGLAFGLFSAIRPRQSIGLYQAIMRWFNWRVEPIEAARELRNTRWLGLVLVLLSLAIFWALFVRQLPRHDPSPPIPRPTRVLT